MENRKDYACSFDTSQYNNHKQSFKPIVLQCLQIEQKSNLFRVKRLYNN
jgi:uncharacterized protein YjbK